MAVVIFDLDDTLYPESDYVKSGFKWIAQFVSMNCGVDELQVFSHLWSGFQSGIRGNAFDLLMQEFLPVSRAFDIESLVTLYRSHIPNIRLYPGIRKLLSDLSKDNIQLGVISDGPAISQRLKFASLGLQHVIRLPVFTDDWGKSFWKPHQRAFELCRDVFGGKPGSYLYVADNPEKDFLAPNKMGWHTIRLRTKPQLHYHVEPPSADHAAQHEVSSIKSLASLIQALIQKCP
ncbi:MAG: HAD family hydrolase [Armatimonadota bacterium]